jgi:hypothetical protein
VADPRQAQAALAVWAVPVGPVEKSQSHRDQIPTTYMYLATLSLRVVPELMVAPAEEVALEQRAALAARAATAATAVP